MKDNTAGHIGNEDGRRCVAALRGRAGRRRLRVPRRRELPQPARVARRRSSCPARRRTTSSTSPSAGYLPGVAAGRPGDGRRPRRSRELQRRADEVLADVRPARTPGSGARARRRACRAFSELYGLSGAVVGAVDLVRGIGRLAGLDVIDVPGATGDLDTDYGAKARAAVAALDDHDLVWVHVEAPDEAGHMGDLREKVRAIERVDAEVLAPLLAAPRAPGGAGAARPLHAVCARARTPAGPVPFVISRAAAGRRAAGGAMAFGERDAAATGLSSPTAPR